MQIMLAIETSQREGSVAVRDQHGAAHVEPLRATKRHDDDLLPAINRLMARLELRPSDLVSVGVSVGPGGFTGLRIAVSTAMMFAEALGVKVAPVPSALVAAQGTPCQAAALLVALASKGETFWATHLKRDAVDDSWRLVGQPALVSSAEFALDGVETVLADDHFPATARARCAAAGVPVIAPVFSADACLQVAGGVLAGGGEIDPLRLSPIYPRKPEAVSIWEKRDQQVQ